jgi:hypothetical protein
MTYRVAPSKASRSPFAQMYRDTVGANDAQLDKSTQRWLDPATRQFNGAGVIYGAIYPTTYGVILKAYSLNNVTIGSLDRFYGGAMWEKEEGSRGSSDESIIGYGSELTWKTIYSVNSTLTYVEPARSRLNVIRTNP